jgi:prepilin-type N-terminal cleavage/methylation domain-containing protein
MRRAPIRSNHRGFTLVELMTALGIFLLICGAAFTLLATSQQRYRNESQVLTSFQEARLALDQIVRDVNDAGYPPPSFFEALYPNLSASSPFAWSPGYTVPSPCTIDGSCLTPGDTDIIIETNPNPQDPTSQVQWIRYQLDNNSTLLRAMVPKTSSHDPAMDTQGNLTPFVQNVVNISAPPGGIPVPLFSYTCDTPTAPQPQPPPCTSAGADNSPANIRDVTVTLIVAAPTPDPTTGAARIVWLTGRGRRVNPNQ